LQKHGGDRGKKQKTGAPEESKSAFQELFTQRAQGFQIDFRFRNAPPRPPVGPCFVGSGLDGVLLDLSQYKPLNAVEVNYRWKLHSEPDLGVPLAPSAMDPKSYTPSTAEPTLHPEDRDLLQWKGSLGDTAAEELKKRRDHARAVARLALIGKSPAKFLEKAKSTVATTTSSKKAFSRVLDETMQSWMKKTTYISNDYTRKVHDFKSLAKTKQDLAEDLQVRQQDLAVRRSGPAISKTFEECKRPIQSHPSKKHLKPVMEMQFLPNVERWGQAYTHLVVDKSPGNVEGLDKAFVANVHKKDINSAMTCQLFVPSAEESKYQAIQQYQLDVLPLKEEDAPHDHFCIWIDPESKIATYMPIASRVQLSTGRPLKKKNYNMNISRRAMNEDDTAEMEERVAEVDVDMEEKVNPNISSTGRSKKMQEDSDDDDNDSDHGESFVNTNRTIVAEG
jgi:RNA polymerase II-associated factor 1